MVKGLDYVGVSVVYFCHDGEGNFLMHKRGVNARDENGKWDIGAGSIEFGDSVEKTLRKEIMEEYNTSVKSFEFLGFRDLHRTHQSRLTHWITLDFKVLIEPKTVKNGEPYKFDEIKWCTINSIPEQKHSQLSIFFEKYKDRLWT